MREQAEQADATRAFEVWKGNNAVVVKTIRQEVLNDLRAAWKKPADWQPTGILSGGRVWYEIVVLERLREAFTARANRFVWGPDDVERY